MKQEYDFSEGVRGKFFRESDKLRFPVSDEKQDWIGPEGPLAKYIIEEAEKSLYSYKAQPRLITEHANQEYDTAHGGYAHRQLFELVQNSADSLLKAQNGKSVLIRLTEDFLYCADDGTPLDKDGITGLMFAHMSSKRNTGAIGRFGLGFKSVLHVTDAPEFYSRPVSFRFDKTRATERIARVALAERYPVLRLPEPIDPHKGRETDEELSELMNWATNIVRLPLKPGAYSGLARQIGDFPPEFLLFVDHVRYLTLENGESSREFILQDRQGELSSRYRQGDHALAAFQYDPSSFRRRSERLALVRLRRRCADPMGLTARPLGWPGSILGIFSDQHGQSRCRHLECALENQRGSSKPVAGTVQQGTD